MKGEAGGGGGMGGCQVEGCSRERYKGVASLIPAPCCAMQCPAMCRAP
jgi:hypothetical protein